MVHSLLDIEDFSSQREYGLIMRIPSLLGRTASRVTLDEEKLALSRIAAFAVGKLAGQAGTL